MSKTLVVALGQLRGASVTFEPFRRHFLDELNADFAVCTTSDAHLDIANPFYGLAKYRWIAPHYQNIGDVIDRVARLCGAGDNWRDAKLISGNWLGGISGTGCAGAGGLLFYLRWHMLQSIYSAGLDQVYDFFIISRTDFLFLAPHPPCEQLGRDRVSIPEGEDYGGLNDRHMVVPAGALRQSNSFLEHFLTEPVRIADKMNLTQWQNIESYVYLQLEETGLLKDLRRFPPVMYLVRANDDPHSWSQKFFDEKLGHWIKYEEEFQRAVATSSLIRERADWDRYFESNCRLAFV